MNDGVVRCRGVREELEHWQRVTALHKNYYFLPERFVIPSSSVTNVVAVQDIPRTPKSTKVIASLTSTPSTHSTASSSTMSSPVKSFEDGSVRLKPPNCCGSPDFLTCIYLLLASTATSSSVPPPHPRPHGKHVPNICKAFYGQPTLP